MILMPCNWIKTKIILDGRILFIRRRNDRFDVMLVQDEPEMLSMRGINEKIKIRQSPERTIKITVALPVAVSNALSVQGIKQLDDGS